MGISLLASVVAETRAPRRPCHRPPPRSCLSRMSRPRKQERDDGCDFVRAPEAAKRNSLLPAGDALGAVPLEPSLMIVPGETHTARIPYRLHSEARPPARFSTAARAAAA